MSDLRLFDSNILIDYLRDDSEAVDCVESSPSQLSISTIVEAELYAGVHDEDERRRIEIMLGEFQVFPVTRSIAVLGGLFKRDYPTVSWDRSGRCAHRCDRGGARGAARHT